MNQENLSFQRWKRVRGFCILCKTTKKRLKPQGNDIVPNELSKIKNGSKNTENYNKMEPKSPKIQAILFPILLYFSAFLPQTIHVNPNFIALKTGLRFIVTKIFIEN